MKGAGSKDEKRAYSDANENGDRTYAHRLLIAACASCLHWAAGASSVFIHSSTSHTNAYTPLMRTVGSLLPSCSSATI